jgi:hypothetical protein
VGLDAGIVATEITVSVTRAFVGWDGSVAVTACMVAAGSFEQAMSRIETAIRKISFSFIVLSVSGILGVFFPEN